MAAKETSTSNFLFDFIAIFGIIDILNIAILKSKIGAKNSNFLNPFIAILSIINEYSYKHRCSPGDIATILRSLGSPEVEI